jgi:hypothetical protein
MSKYLAAAGAIFLGLLWLLEQGGFVKHEIFVATLLAGLSTTTVVLSAYSARPTYVNGLQIFMYLLSVKVAMLGFHSTLPFPDHDMYALIVKIIDEKVHLLLNVSLILSFTMFTTAVLLHLARSVLRDEDVQDVAIECYSIKKPTH